MKFAGLKEIISFTGLLFVCFIFDHSAAQEKFLFDLKKVADKPPADVEKILGKPSKLVDDSFRDSRGNTYPSIRAAYMNEGVEITYIEGGARYLTIWVQKLSERYQDYSYPKDGWTLLGELGLDRNTTADFSNHTATRWRDLPGVYEINIFPTAENKIWYAHVFINRIYG